MHQPREEQRSTFRLDVPLHQLLTSSVSERVEFQPIGLPQRFPDPVFPQHPELLGPMRKTTAGGHRKNAIGMPARSTTRCRAGFFRTSAPASPQATSIH